VIIDPDPGAASRFADELAAHGGGARIGLVTDETSARLHLSRYVDALSARGLGPSVVVVPDGEGSKSLARAAAVAEQWADSRLDRQAIAVALGGGVVGDLGGFVASIYLRGIRYVQVPTTLLAQVDSSIGGKTGVNLSAGKNLAGTVYQPLFVYADVTTLATLSERDRVAGLAEVIKHGVIADAALLSLVETRVDAARAGEPALLAELVARSCAVKARIVAADERETTGARALLNFGHTVGHALEAASHTRPDPWRHGEAVALGMLAAARVGAALGVGAADLESRLRALFARLGLPCDLDSQLDADTLARMAVDKKISQGAVSFVVVDQVGSAHLEPLTLARVSEILLPRSTKMMRSS
jgi:3-dehydroquinate synthase